MEELDSKLAPLYDKLSPGESVIDFIILKMIQKPLLQDKFVTRKDHSEFKK